VTGLHTTLLVASLIMPLAFLGACLVKGWRERVLALQWLALHRDEVRKRWT